MLSISTLSAKGAYEVLLRLSTGDAKFKDLNSVVKNTRTLTRRLRDLESAGLIDGVEGSYKITNAGFEALVRVYDVEIGSGWKWVNMDEFKKLRYNWLSIPFKGLVKLFLEELSHNLVSIALYGSSVKESFKMGESDVDMLYIVEDDVENFLAHEAEVFKRFRSTYEYAAFDHWFKMRGLYGYPEITVTSLRRSHALNFQPIYLDMILHRAILYDKNNFLKSLIQRLQNRLKALGAERIEYTDGLWYWVLKPDLKPGEILEIDLKRD